MDGMEELGASERERKCRETVAESGREEKVCVE